MPPAARISDMHNCPMVTGVVPHVGGPIAKGEPTVLIGFLPAARVGDIVTCAGPPDTIVKGSPTVLIGYMPAARMGDNTAHGGAITVGHPTTMIGDAGEGGGGGGGGGGDPGIGGGTGPGSAADDAGPSETASSAAAAATSLMPAQVTVKVIEQQNREAAESGAALCEVCEPEEPGEDPT